MTDFLLIRHAASAPSADQPEPDWPLSNAGADAAHRLVSSLADRPIDAIYASPYARAVATVGPLAGARSLRITRVEPLRERKLSEAMVPDWRDHLEHSWLDFDYRLPGGESARECQQRMIACLTSLAQSHGGESLVVCSHGNALSLFLNSLDPSFGFAAWQTMSNPALYRVCHDHAGWSWDGADGAAG